VLAFYRSGFEAILIGVPPEAKADPDTAYHKIEWYFLPSKFHAYGQIPVIAGSNGCSCADPEYFGLTASAG
jgi:hypothetical protein